MAHANECRDWRIYADLAQMLIVTARQMYRDELFGAGLKEVVYASDATTIDLCLALLSQRKARRHKSSVQLLTLLGLRGSLPANIYVFGGQVHEGNILDRLFPRAGALRLLDRGYVDFARL